MNDNEETFLPSQQSRKAVRYGLLIGMTIALFPLFRGHMDRGGWIIVGVALLITFGLDFYVGRSYRRAYATLDDDGIQSAHFQGRAKFLAWDNIASIARTSYRNSPMLLNYGATPMLAFALREKESIGLFGSKTGKVILPLGQLDKSEQAALLQALDRRMQAVSANMPPLAAEFEQELQLDTYLEQLTPTPWATYALVAINVAIWLITVMLGADIAHATPAQLFAWGGNAASEVQHGQWWRLLSATFLHASLMHVAMNMLGLYSAGVMLERIYGPRLYVLIYLGAGLIGSGLSLSFAAQQAVSVGASGAVFGVCGALLIAVFQHREKLPKTFSTGTMSSMGIFIAYSLLNGFTHHGIDNAAHVGGLLGGCLLAFILPERFDMAHYRRLQASRTVMAIAAALVATATLAAVAPRASVDQRSIFASAPFMQKGFQTFDAALRALKQDNDDVKAGRLSAREADERTRTVFAPRFRQVVADLSHVVLGPNDPRAPLLQDTRHMAELMTEISAMNSTFAEGSDVPIPANPERMKQLEQAVAVLAPKIRQDVAALKAGAAAVQRKR